MHPADIVLLMAAILQAPCEPDDMGIAASVLIAHRMVEFNERHEQWARAVHESQFKSKWFPTGESRDIEF